MTPLEAAKRLRDHPPMWEGENGNPSCAVCRAPTYIADGNLSADPIVYTEPEHAEDCPIPVMPKIVAALAAADALIEGVRWKEVPVSAELIWFEEDEYGKARVDGEHVHRLGLALKGEES